MSRITKQLAEQVAIKLTEDKKANIKLLKDKLKTIATEHYLKTIPKEVKDFYKKHPKYTKQTSYVNLVGAGLEYNHTDIDNSPHNGNSNQVKVTNEEANIVVDVQRLIEDAQKEYRDLVSEIEIALLGLRTFKNVQEKFPEAYEFLPEISYNTSLAINLKDVRCKINPAVCEQV